MTKVEVIIRADTLRRTFGRRLSSLPAKIMRRNIILGGIIL